MEINKKIHSGCDADKMYENFSAYFINYNEQTTDTTDFNILEQSTGNYKYMRKFGYSKIAGNIRSN